MTIHKEGYLSILLVFLFVVVVIYSIYLSIPILLPLFIIAGILFWGFIIQFFRHPNRVISQFNDKVLYAPADGKVVVIEETEESEYFKDKRLMISIFMSPLNVHCNRIPFSGIVKYVQHHSGKYLVAWHPKSSTENERTTTVIESEYASVLVRQIAGAVARRICNYMAPGQEVKQGQELGFIKFGSRVDIFLPIGTKINVKIGQAVKANIDVIGEII